MRARLAALLAATALPFAAVACGGSGNASPPGFEACAKAWNASANAGDRATVARLYREGYIGAGIQLNLTLGARASNHSDPNPVGCRVVVFTEKRWVAYLARRDGNHFLFRASAKPGVIADQRGRWPGGVTPEPRNATVSADGTVAVAMTHRQRATATARKAVIRDWAADGHVDGPHSCAAVRSAVVYLSQLTFEHVSDKTLGGAERRYCGLGPPPLGAVWTIERGMTEDQVRTRLGAPSRVLADLNGPEPGRIGPCLIYPATQPGTSIDYRYFCLNSAGRVAKIRLGIHG